MNATITSLNLTVSIYLGEKKDRLEAIAILLPPYCAPS